MGPVRDIEANLKLSLENLVREMGLSDFGEFTGAVPTKMVFTYIDATDVGVIPYRNTIHTNNMAGHKTYIYMAAGKPLIVTNVQLQAQIVGKEGCGLLVPPDDPHEVAEAIVKLYRDPQLRQELGDRGRVAVEKQYNWATGSQDFVRMVGEIAEEFER